TFRSRSLRRRPPRSRRCRPPRKWDLRAALERTAAEVEDGGIRELLRRRRDSLTPDLQWLLLHRPAPPLLQDGPQCGLVALWMGGSLVAPGHGLTLAQVVQTALERRYTLQGEMFSGI
ncbi:UPF0692 protein C19orf54 homolog, partial [Gallus gallus]|uniref:UPF0692 protein C19orf54 homolog n=1 Tax=Gallus gallus TaxID=9031 RepID=UPI001AE778EF